MEPVVRSYGNDGMTDTFMEDNSMADIVMENDDGMQCEQSIHSIAVQTL